MAGFSSDDVVQIYTDGGCDPNPGPGGWGAVLIYGLKTLELSGADPATTNNRMELTAAIEALKALKRPCSVTVHTDSRYLQRGISEWLDAWKRHDWRKANGQPVENQDLWMALDEQVTKHHVVWEWIKGHHGHPLNERVDQLASEARKKTGKILINPVTSGTVPVADEPMAEIRIYCRACALGVPGPAGYAAVLVPVEGQPQVISGGWKLASSNVMELWAAIAGLRALKRRSQVEVFTTSKYLYDNVTKRLASWERNHWRTQDGQQVKNLEIWRELVSVLGDHDISWKYEPGDTTSEYSVQAARLARKEAEAQARLNAL